MNTCWLEKIREAARNSVSPNDPAEPLSRQLEMEIYLDEDR
jgi:hypothetical protein